MGHKQWVISHSSDGHWVMSHKQWVMSHSSDGHWVTPIDTLPALLQNVCFTVIILLSIRVRNI